MVEFNKTIVLVIIRRWHQQLEQVHQLLECCIVEMALTVGRCINLLECSIAAIEQWHQQLEQVHQLLECCVVEDRKLHQQLERGINRWNDDLKLPQHLECASNVGIETENAPIIGNRHQLLECA